MILGQISVVSDFGSDFDSELPDSALTDPNRLLQGGSWLLQTIFGSFSESDGMLVQLIQRVGRILGFFESETKSEPESEPESDSNVRPESKPEPTTARTHICTTHFPLCARI
eukprot:8991549-Heterocapsa_arctica.AAC.1